MDPEHAEEPRQQTFTPLSERIRNAGVRVLRRMLGHEASLLPVPLRQQAEAESPLPFHFRFEDQYMDLQSYLNAHERGRGERFDPDEAERRLADLYTHLPEVEDELYRSEDPSDILLPLSSLARALHRHGVGTVQPLERFFVRNMKRMEAIAGSGSPRNRENVLSLCAGLVSFENLDAPPGQRELSPGNMRHCVSFLESHTDDLFQLLGEVPHVNGIVSTLETLLQYGSSQNREQILAGLRPVLPDNLRVLAAAADSPVDALREMALPVVRERVGRYGIDPDILLPVWAANGSGRERNLYTNILALDALTEADPGFPSLLLHEYGIHNFGRYPVDLLITQARHHGDTSLVNGAVLFPEVEASGAAAGLEWPLGSLAEQTGNGFLARVSEARDGESAISQLLKNAEHNGPIRFALGTAHGDERGMYYGDGPEGAITVDDIDAGAVDRLRDAFDPEAVMLLCSCSTGAGFAQKLSERLHIQVTGPETPTTLSFLQCIPEESHLHLIPQYDGGVAARSFRNGSPATITGQILD
jgi:hypothetical protein